MRSGASPKKSLGQHFLRDSGIAARVVRAAHIPPDGAVLEVGPGRGALTGRLVQLAGTVVLVELDPEIADMLRRKYADLPKVHVIEADARELDVEAIPELRDRPYRVVANLPYYAASPIVRLFLEASHPPEELVVMLQREVAQEMAAPPGRLGILSVATQFYAEPEIVFDVPPEAFFPPPKVMSSVIRLRRRSAPLVAVDDPDAFFQVVRAGFKAPRKQLRNSLARGLGIEPADAGLILEEAGIDPMRRPATLSIPEWGSVYTAWKVLLGNGKPEIT